MKKNVEDEDNRDLYAFVFLTDKQQSKTELWYSRLWKRRRLKSGTAEWRVVGDGKKTRVKDGKQTNGLGLRPSDVT